MSREDHQRQTVVDRSRALVWDLDGDFSGVVEHISAESRAQMADYVLKWWNHERRGDPRWAKVKRLVNVLDPRAFQREAAVQTKPLPGTDAPSASCPKKTPS